MNDNTFLRIWNIKYTYDSNSSLRSIFCNKYLYKDVFLQTFLTVLKPFILGITGYAHLHLSSIPPSLSLKFICNGSDGIKDVCKWYTVTSLADWSRHITGTVHSSWFHVKLIMAGIWDPGCVTVRRRMWHGWLICCAAKWWSWRLSAESSH
jgi:hypothetical protein